MKKVSGRREPVELFPKLVQFFSKKPTVLLIVVVLWAACASLLLFDVKLSTGGDDAMYILQANDFIRKGIPPVGFKSPGYPILLSVLVFLFGMNILLLKLSSYILFLIALISFYFIFNDRLERTTFILSFIVFASNLLVIEYSCHTYSEMTFLVIELWVLWTLFTLEEKGKGDRILYILLLAALAMVGFYIRAIGATLPIAIALWFLYNRKYKPALLFTVACGVFYSPLKVIEWIRGQPVMAQSSDLFKVNPYNPALGMETLDGFLVRFRDNLFIHFNYMFPKALGLPHNEEHAVANGVLIHDASSLVAIALSFILILGIVTALRRKERTLSFFGLYTAVYVISISLALQTFFATPRMLVPMVPLLIPLFLYGLQVLLHRVRKTNGEITPSFRRWYSFSVLLIVLSTLYYLGGAVQRHYPILKANLKGNEFAGYPPDWVNYLRACRWIAQNLPRDSVGVICRKAEHFRIYTDDYKVYGVYSIESTNPDTLIAHWKAWGMTHILYDNFQWSSTLRRYVQPALSKYPQMFTIVHQEGQMSPSFVLRIEYEKYHLGETIQ